MNGDDSVKSAINHPDYGDITLDWGKPGTPKEDFKNGYGLSHIAVRRLLKGNDPADSILDAIETIVNGKKNREYGNKPGTRVELEHNGNVAILSLYRNNDKETWLLTGFKKWSGAQEESGNQKGYTKASSKNNLNIYVHPTIMDL